MGRLLLWDIDGTPVPAGGVGGAAITQAALQVAGRALTGEEVVMHGKTDPQIIAELFRAAEVADDDIPTLVPLAVAECERLLAAAEAQLREQGEVVERLGGADVALPDLTRTDEVVALLTG